MSPLLALLALMLPVLTMATGNPDETGLYTLFPSSNITGDILNVTQCYCESSHPLYPDAKFGYYYLAEYFNYHLQKSYSVTASCTSPAPDNLNGTEPDDCIYYTNELKKLCNDNEDGNQFCFKFKEDANNLGHSLPSASKYFFNDDKRKVPGQPSDIMAQDNVTQNCGFYCQNELGGLTTPPTHPFLIPGLSLVANSIVSWTDLDDMCYTCA